MEQIKQSLTTLLIGLATFSVTGWLLLNLSRGILPPVS